MSSFGNVNNVDLNIQVRHFKSTLESDVTDSKTDNDRETQKIFNSEAVNEGPFNKKRDSNQTYNNQYADSDTDQSKINDLRFEVENISHV